MAMYTKTKFNRVDVTNHVIVLLKEKLLKKNSKFCTEKETAWNVTRIENRFNTITIERLHATGVFVSVEIDQYFEHRFVNLNHFVTVFCPFVFQHPHDVQKDSDGRKHNDSQHRFCRRHVRSNMSKTVREDSLQTSNRCDKNIVLDGKITKSITALVRWSANVSRQQQGLVTCFPHSRNMKRFEWVGATNVHNVCATVYSSHVDETNDCVFSKLFFRLTKKEIDHGLVQFVGSVSFSTSPEPNHASKRLNFVWRNVSKTKLFTRYKGRVWCCKCERKRSHVKFARISS